LHRARSHVTHKKNILVEANALYDTKFAKTIVKKSLCKTFFFSFLLQSTDTTKKKEKKYQQRLKKKKKEEKNRKDIN